MTFLRRPIFLILLFALILRLWGIDYALPQFFVNDERAIVYGALKMLELKTLVPAWHEEEFRKVLNYLPLPSYIYLFTLTPVIGFGYLFSGALDLAAYREALVLDPTLIFLTARIIIALMGVATIYLTYRLARGIFESERAGLIAAIFLAVSFYHVQLSQVTRQWMPALLFLALAWLASLEIYRRGSLKGYVLTGLFAGLGVGANTAVAVAMIPPVLAHFLRPAVGTEPSTSGARFAERIRDPKLWLSIAVFLGVSSLFIALYPYGLTQGETPGGTAVSTLVAKFSGLAGKNVAGWLSFFWFYVRLLFTYETVLLIAAIGGAFLAWKFHRSWVGIAAVFAIGYLTLLYLFFNIIPRGALFILPILAVFAGYAADRLILRAQNLVRATPVRTFLVFVFWFLVLFAWPLAFVFRYDYLLTRADTRLLAAEWLYQNLPPDARLLADLSSLRITNTKEGVKTLSEIAPGGLRVEDRTLLQVPDARYPEPNREVLNLHFVNPDSLYRQQRERDFFTARGYRYFAVEYEYAGGQDLNPQSRALAAQGRLVARFQPGGAVGADRVLDISGEIATIPLWQLWELERFGQIVEIYEL